MEIRERDLTMADEEIQKEQTSAPSTPPAASGSTSAGSFLIKERFEVLFDSPLPQHNANDALAYKVSDRISPKRELFALVCSNETSPRLSLIPYLKSIDNSHIMKLIDYGIAVCPPHNTQQMALIYQLPGGPRITGFDKVPDLRKNPEKFKQIFFSLISALECLKSYSLTHRAIRLDNMYFKDETCSEIMLGDCLAGFPAFHQPPAYETIESLMSDREGRGDGHDSQDIYAAGVAILSMLYRKELLKDLSAPEVLRLKLKRSSYSVLTAEDKMPNPYVNLFKGILLDRNDERWTYTQIYNFLDGKPNSFGIAGNSETPKKSLTVGGDKFYTPTGVALALQNNPQEAMELINNGKLLEWVRSGIEDEKLYSKLEKFFKQGTGETLPQIIVCKTCILLNPAAPIRYDGVAAFPDGMAKAVFYTLKNRGNLKPFIDIFSNDLIKTWYMEQTNARSPVNAAEFKIYINRQDYGYGIERIIYDIDADLPCTSPLFGDEFVISVPQILKALDNTYAEKVVTTAPFDKIIIAYLRCKLGKKIDNILTEINSSKTTTQISGILHLYSDIQKKLGPAQLPHLAQWLINYSIPLIKSYHNVKYQKYLEHEIVRYAKDGRLMDVYGILENEEAHNNDLRQYVLAVKETNGLIALKTRLLNDSGKIEEETRETALRFGTVIAVLVMTFSLIINLINWIVKQ